VRWDWVHLTRRPLFGLLYQLRMIDDECGAVGGMRIGRENGRTRRKPSQCHFVHHKFHKTWSALEAGTPRWEAGDKPPELWHGPPAEEVGQGLEFEYSSLRERTGFLWPSRSANYVTNYNFSNSNSMKYMNITLTFSPQDNSGYDVSRITYSNTLLRNNMCLHINQNCFSPFLN
jgi:hypothetical protein